MLPLITPMIRECLTNPETKVQSSGLEILTLLLENAGTTFAGQEAQITDLVVPFLTSSN